MIVKKFESLYKCFLKNNWQLLSWDYKEAHLKSKNHEIFMPTSITGLGLDVQLIYSNVPVFSMEDGKVKFIEKRENIASIKVYAEPNYTPFKRLSFISQELKLMDKRNMSKKILQALSNYYQKPLSFDGEFFWVNNSKVILPNLELVTEVLSDYFPKTGLIKCGQEETIFIPGLTNSNPKYYSGEYSPYCMFHSQMIIHAAPVILSNHEKMSDLEILADLKLI